MEFKDMINKVIQGDCLEVMKDIPDKSVDLLLTDIPYNEVNRKSNGLRNLNKGIADSSLFDMDLLLGHIHRICRGSIYIFCGIEQVSIIRKYFVSNNLSTRHCVWEKTNPSPMNGQHIWLSAIENCIFAKNKNATFSAICKSSVWRYPVELNQEHPTQKNLNLFKYLISVSSNITDIVLDCFLGSGTTAVACKELGRNFIGIEKEQKYCDIANERLRILDMQPKFL